MKVPFTKAATTWQQQLALLEARGMDIGDRAEAEHRLRHVQYYRLGAYWLPFEADHATHQFKPGTTLAAVWDLYEFDRELRLLVMDAIERVEVSVRGRWAYEVAHNHGPHAHLDATYFNPKYWQKNLDMLREAVNRSDETFIKHLRGRYSEALPPAWAVCEVMSLGQLSRWFDSLMPMPTRRAVAGAIGFDEHVAERFLHHLTTVRNVCAHHGRLWNREFTVIPQLPRTKPLGLKAQLVPRSRRLYNTLVLLAHSLNVVSPGNHWRDRLLVLCSRRGADYAAMGFPANWKGMPIWKP